MYRIAVCDYPLQREDVLTVASGSWVYPRCRVTQKKVHQELKQPGLIIQRSKLGISGSLSQSCIPLGKKLFLLSLGLICNLQKIKAYSCRTDLANPSVGSFTVRKELNPLEEFSGFMGITFCISVYQLGIGPSFRLEQTVKDLIWDGRIYNQTNHSFTFPF